MSCKGYTLIEILVALVILIIVVLGVAAGFPFVIDRNHQAVQLSQAICISTAVRDCVQAGGGDCFSDISGFDVDSSLSGSSATVVVKWEDGRFSFEREFPLE